jgi:hypothetical protein
VVGGGAVICWGDNYAGRATVPAGLTGVTQVSAGAVHTCAVGSGGAVTCWGNNDYGQTTVQTTATRVLPTASFGATPGSVSATQSFTLAMTNAQVPGYPATTTFTYAFDCGAGTYGVPSATATASCPTSVAGALTVRGKVIDQDGDVAEYQASVSVALGAQAIVFASTPPSPAYVGMTYAPSAGAGGSGNVVSFGSATPGTCTVSLAIATFIAPGLCTITADQAGDATYAAAPQQTQSFSITLRPQKIVVTSVLPASAIVSATFILSATGGGSFQPVVFASQTPATCTTTGTDGTTLTAVAAGACTVQATQAGNATYAAATPVSVGLLVTAPVALTPAQRIAALRAAVVASGIKSAVSSGLTDKLDAALAALAKGQTGVGCSNLAAFVSQVQAQRGKAIVAATADAWLAEAAAIRAALGC